MLLLPPGSIKWLTPHFVFNLVKCFCYRQVPRNGPPHIMFENLPFHYTNLVGNNIFLSNIGHTPRMPTPPVNKLAFRYDAVFIRAILVWSQSNTETTPPHILLPFGPYWFAHKAIPKPHSLTSCFHLGHMGLLSRLSLTSS